MYKNKRSLRDFVANALFCELRVERAPREQVPMRCGVARRSVRELLPRPSVCRESLYIVLGEALLGTPGVPCP